MNGTSIDIHYPIKRELKSCNKELNSYNKRDFIQNIFLARINRANTLHKIRTYIEIKRITMSNKHEKLAERLASILVELNTSGQIDINELAERFSIGIRTLQKDLNERLVFLNWEQNGPRFYRLNRAQLGVFTKEDIERFAHFASVQDLFPKIDREFFQHSLNESIAVKGLHYETIQHRQQEFKQLQNAIEKHCLVQFTYQKLGTQNASNREVEPYVLLNKNGVWYLIGLENGKQKTFCFTQIYFLKITDKTFKPNEKFLSEIQKSDSIYHGNQISEVVIKVDASVAHYFTRRNLLPNQETIRKLENGELLLSCKNIHELEIIPLVQYWIPHLVIVSPNELQNKMLTNLQNYIQMNR